jgi:tRNA(Met) cytidine acetyltransferase
LGFMANALQEQGKQLLLTAPSRAAARSVFRHANNAVSFLAPDGVLADVSITTDVLLVDEAAAISLPVLLALLQRFPQVIFATTTEGYEGTGQGFVLRFLRELNTVSPNWQQHTLAAPIRWAENDPLEQLLYRLFLLDAEPTPLANPIVNTSRVMAVSQQTLLEKPHLLREVYGLLRSAHYRTTPDDLRFLLDAPGVSLFVMQADQQLIGVALCVQEGELDDGMANAIAAGERRPRGHLLVQTLAVQEAQPQYLQQRVSRVVRIAIHPSLQGQGYGSRLLQAVVEQQRELGVNVIGSSFSATPDVLAFWQKNGFTLERIGHRRQKASAAPSAVVLRELQ